MGFLKHAITLSALGLLSLVHVGCGEGGSGDNGGNPSTDACSVIGLQTRIINGSSCTDSTSAVVRLSLLDSIGNEYICSGTLISSQYVLSAAHCFTTANITTIRVVIGGRTITGSSYVIHPGVQIDAVNGAVLNDASLVKLAQAATVTPLPLVSSENVSAGALVSIFGYGFDENGGIGTLQSGQMEVSSVSENHIFAAYGGEGSNVCNGDSGGPAIYTTAFGISGVVGITSTGRRIDCGPGDITLFANTQTNSILNWVFSIVTDAELI
jgi:secreted trypsin-like serine protease